MGLVAWNKRDWLTDNSYLILSEKLLSISHLS